MSTQEPSSDNLKKETVVENGHPRLNQYQTVVLTVFLAFIVSAATTIGVIYYFSKNMESLFQLPSFNILPSEKSEKIVKETKEINEKILRQDELVVGVVKKVSPSVVTIVATKDVAVVEQYFTNPFPSDPFFDQFFEQFQVPQYRKKGTQPQEVSAGSGFIISSDGLILSNKHVVADTDASYTVFFSDGSKVSAKVLARDPFQDLAVLKIEKTGLPVVTLADSSKTDIGQTVIAIGNALDFRNTVSVGIVSGLGRSITASGGGLGAEELQELIQTDAAINPGNSGGPLLNLWGEVIGINTAMAQGAENIGFAIPINKAKRDIASIKSSGKIVYPFLGIRYIIVNKTLQEDKKLAVDYGALLVGGQDGPSVTKGGPAEAAGLKEWDIVLSINGEKITSDNTLTAILQKYAVGDTATLKVMRDGKEFSASLKLAERKQ